MRTALISFVLILALFVATACQGKGDQPSITVQAGQPTAIPTTAAPGEPSGRFAAHRQFPVVRPVYPGATKEEPYLDYDIVDGCPAVVTESTTADASEDVISFYE